MFWNQKRRAVSKTRFISVHMCGETRRVVVTAFQRIITLRRILRFVSGGGFAGVGGEGTGNAVVHTRQHPHIRDKTSARTRVTSGRQGRTWYRWRLSSPHARHELLDEPHVIAHELGRDPVPLQIGNQGPPRGFDIFGRLDDAARVHADVRDVHKRVRGGARDQVCLDGFGGGRGRRLCGGRGGCCCHRGRCGCRLGLGLVPFHRASTKGAEYG